MIQTFDAVLPHGITLACRATGAPGAPVLVFLHGFPEAAFVWDEILEHFGERYRCIAPNLRGFGPSSAPVEPEQYRVKHLMADLEALIAQQAGGGPIEALVAHDWGGAVAWTLAALKPELMKRLVIINSPHPATFLRELQHSPQQQAASAYMNFLCRPDAERLLAENDYARMWPMFENMGAADPAREGGGWLTAPVRDQYRAIWNVGLTGGCNYYRASPLRPPTAADAAVLQIEFAPEFVTVRRPTLVIWAEDDTALPTPLIDGLDAFVPDMRLVRVPGATHWIIHERPDFIAAEIEKHLAPRAG
ncbi:MAG TPA: alpha/beta hydrolase [Burkholderiaceae bacterium]|nr:alpha/beta hydrolase [Burkholderiaceae bacterium]